MLFANSDIALSLLTTTISLKHRNVHADGSAFFYEHQNEVYLITNRHLIINEKDHFYPTTLTTYLHRKSEKSPEELGHLNRSEKHTVSLYKTEKGKKVPLWLGLPGIDIVAIPLKIPKKFVIRCFQADDFPREKLLVEAGDGVLVIGYPEGFFDKTNNLPIVISGTVATCLPSRFENTRSFLINSDATYGNSGSAVVRKEWSINLNEKLTPQPHQTRLWLVGILTSFVPSPFDLAKPHIENKTERMESKLKLCQVLNASIIEEMFVPKVKSSSIRKKASPKRNSAKK